MIKSIEFSKLKKMIIEKEGSSQINDDLQRLKKIIVDDSKIEYKLFKKLFDLHKNKSNNKILILKEEFWKDPSNMDLLYEYALMVGESGDREKALILLDRVSRSRYKKACDALTEYFRLSGT
jgi:thioredoxin-like negative regulator of GroEL